MLIKSIDEVKNVLRISNLDSDSSLPDILSAEERYIVPVIGQALYDDLQTKYDANTLSPTEAALLLRIQKPLAAFAYHDDLSLQHAQITDAGVRRMTTDNMPSAYRWEFDGVKDALLTRALQGIESLYDYMEKNAGSFALWTASTAYTRRNRFLIKNGIDFNDQYHVYHPFRTYEAMTGIMGDVEELYVSNLIGKDFFTALKALASPSTEEKKVIADLKKAVANLCIHHAIEKLPVKITDNGITIHVASSDRGDSDKQTAGNDLLQLNMKACYRDGQNYLTKAKKYLDATASVSIFPVYFASENYSAPIADEDKVDPNEGRKFFTFIK